MFSKLRQVLIVEMRNVFSYQFRVGNRNGHILHLDRLPIESAELIHLSDNVNGIFLCQYASCIGVCTCDGQLYWEKYVCLPVVGAFYCIAAIVRLLGGF